MEFQVTDEIKLRPYVESDAEEILATVKANYDHLREFLAWVVPDYSREAAKTFIEESRKMAEANERQVYGIFVNDELAGTIGFIKLDRNARKTEIGYWLAKGFEGRGIVTGTCRRLIDYAFDDLELNRIEIRAVTANKRSRAVPERLGFTLEGILRQSLCIHTRLHDLAVYGLLKEDWRK